jgi:Tfp pilus assembly protein PilO
MIRLIIGTVAMVAAGGIFFFYTQPAYDSMQTQQAKIDQYNQALTKAAELQTLKSSLLTRYNSFDPTSLDRLQKLLPDHVDNIALILDLDSIASRYGLGLQNVDISTSGAQTPTNQTAIGAIGNNSQQYDSLTLTFSTQGTYANFLQFLSDLESSLRIVDLATLSVSRAPSSPGTSVSDSRIYAYTITLRTYWLK